MKTYTIEVSRAQLDLVQVALKAYLATEHAPADNLDDLEEMELIVGMIDDIDLMDEPDSIHGFCY